MNTKVCLGMAWLALLSLGQATDLATAQESQLAALKSLPANTWARANPGEPPAAPWSRALSAAVYCDRIARTFYWGGSYGNSQGGRYYAELYDAAANTWTRIGPEKPGQDTPPLALTHAMLAYDPEKNFVLHAQVSPDPARSRTWAFDLDAGKWKDLAPATQPRVVANSAAVHDARNRRTVLFGGSHDRRPQTWLYDSAANQWTNAEPKTSPPARIWHRMAYDSANGLVVLFGGHDGKRELGDTWLYETARNEWRQARPAVAPPARCGQGMAFDSKRGLNMLFGGSATKFPDEADEDAFLYCKSHSDTGRWFADLWAYDAKADRWTELKAQAGPPPDALVSGAMVYDPSADRLVLVSSHKPSDSDARRKYNTAQVWVYRPDGQ